MAATISLTVSGWLGPATDRGARTTSGVRMPSSYGHVFPDARRCWPK